jgi:hypothetical protein
MSHFIPKPTFLSYSAGVRLLFVGALLAVVGLFMQCVLS